MLKLDSDSAKYMDWSNRAFASDRFRGKIYWIRSLRRRCRRPESNSFKLSVDANVLDHDREAWNFKLSRVRASSLCQL